MARQPLRGISLTRHVAPVARRSRSATTCRSAQSRTCCDVDRQTPSGLQSAVELHLDKKRWLASNLIRPAQFLDFAFKRFYSFTLSTRYAVALASVDLFTLHPAQQRRTRTADHRSDRLDCRPHNECSPRCSRTRRTAHSGLPGKTLISCSRLHSLKVGAVSESGVVQFSVSWGS